MNQYMNQYMNQNEYKIINGHKNLIVCFGGMALKIGGALPFEFLNYLSPIYKNDCDLIFYTDKYQCLYHKGIHDITNNIDETIVYLNNIIETGKYEKVIFMGTSAGGYASILFGSMCENVSNVISFIPQTILKKPVDPNYSNLKNRINTKTKYLLYGDTSIKNANNYHHISHCENIECFANVEIIRNQGCLLKTIRDSGFIKRTIDSIIL